MSPCSGDLLLTSLYGTAQFKFDIYTSMTREFLDKFLVPLTSLCEQIIKIYIYARVTLESLESLASCMQGLNKFVGLLVSCIQVVNKFVGPLMNYTQAHDLMHL